jgi:hypothetical protein
VEQHGKACVEFQVWRRIYHVGFLSYVNDVIFSLETWNY